MLLEIAALRRKLLLDIKSGAHAIFLKNRHRSYKAFCNFATVCILALPISSIAAEWRIVPDNVIPDLAETSGPVIGAVLVDSIKRNGDYAEAKILMFYNYELAQAAGSLISSTDKKNKEAKLKYLAALADHRADKYMGMEILFTYRGAGFIKGDDEIRTLLVASEVLIDLGYPPISTRTIQVQCESKVDFGSRYNERDNWTTFMYPNNGSINRGTLYPFICDKAGMGQNERTPPPPPSPEVLLYQKIMNGSILPKWKFLGTSIDSDRSTYLMFLASDTIQKKNGYTEVIMGRVPYTSRSVYDPSPEQIISGIQTGKYRPRIIFDQQVNCDTEEIIGGGNLGIKMLEMQLAAYVCANNKKLKK